MRVLALYFPRLGIQLARAASPDLAGKPLALLAGEGDGALVAAVSVEATADGVEAGMTALQARQRCRGIVFERDNAARCLAELEALASILRTRTTTRVAMLSRNALGMSLAGLEGRFAGEGAAAQGILALARSWSGLDVRAAVASHADAAVCAASKARRFPVIAPEGDEPLDGLPVYGPVSTHFTFERPASAEMARARLVRMLGGLQPLLDGYSSSYREVHIELAHGPFRTAYLLRCDTPIHNATEAIDLIRARFSGDLEGVKELRVTLHGVGPGVKVAPWRAPMATVHELSAPAVPVQRRLLRAS